MWKTLLRRFRSWQALTAGVLVVVVAAVYIVMVNARAKQTAPTIDAIERLNGMVFRKYSNDLSIPGLPRSFGPLVHVSFLGPKAGDRELEVLRGIPELRRLVLINTRVTDEGIAWLARFPKLSYLSIGNLDSTKNSGFGGALNNNPTAQWTGKGLKALTSLPNLQSISLAGPQTTDADLPALMSLKRLLVIDLYKTSVTKKGVVKLQKALPNCRVSYR
jgi:hypothetical protein